MDIRFSRIPLWLLMDIGWRCTGCLVLNLKHHFKQLKRLKTGKAYSSCTELTVQAIIWWWLDQEQKEKMAWYEAKLFRISWPIQESMMCGCSTLEATSIQGTIYGFILIANQISGTLVLKRWHKEMFQLAWISSKIKETTQKRSRW